MTKRAFGIAAAALLLATVSFAHAVLLSATPAANGIIAGPDVRVELRFNSRIDAPRSRLALVLPDRTVRDVPLEPSSAPAFLRAHVNGLSPGAYRMQWQVLATDGHITRGEIPFQVK